MRRVVSAQFDTLSTFGRNAIEGSLHRGSSNRDHRAAMAGEIKGNRLPDPGIRSGHKSARAGQGKSGHLDVLSGRRRFAGSATSPPRRLPVASSLGDLLR
jgi:hypothetical protein